MAIVHIAMFDAVNAIAGGYRSYTGVTRVPHGTALGAAVAQAAHDTLTALYPSQEESFDDRLAEDLGRVPDGSGKTNGIDLGKRTAAAILAQRVADGSEAPEPRLGVTFSPSSSPGTGSRIPSA